MASAYAFTREEVLLKAGHATSVNQLPLIQWGNPTRMWIGEPFFGMGALGSFAT
jgi:hypothetical protein